MTTKLTARLTALTALLFSVLLGENSQTNAAEVPDNMVWIPPGTFTMGSPTTEKESDSDETQHTVTLTKNFYMSKYEVTQKEYLAVMGNNPSYFTTKDWNGKPISPDLNRPVEHVGWNDATNYCAKVTASERAAGRLSVGWKYRLPTEAEWEYACRAGTTTPFHYGPDLRSGMANFDGRYEYMGGMGTVSNSNGIYLVRTTAVGSYQQPNAFGLYDMHGNVWEWCLDWYGAYASGSVTDPRGPSTGPSRVLRGGGGNDHAWQCRSAYRDYFVEGDRDDDVGFRVVLAWDLSTPIQPTDPPKKEEPKPALVLTPEQKEVIEKQTVRPTYSEAPKKESSTENLVVVTHGRIPKEFGQTAPPNPDWVDEMVKAIRQNLESRSLKNWQVEPYKWTEKAWTGKSALLLGTLLDNAEQEGGNLGNSIVSKEWKHVHLIAHSAGAAVIQTAAEVIKGQDNAVTIHCTFLDAYVGSDYYGGRSKYGEGVTWADSYFSHDPETLDDLFGRTKGPLDHAYNVEVTWLDTNRQKVQVSTSASLGNVSQTCYQTKSSHGWPCRFYMNTIPPNTQFGSENLGFLLSKEAGNWDNTANQYKVGKNALRVLGSSELPCTPNPSTTSLNIELPRDFSQLPNASIIMNSPEHIVIHGLDFTLKTASPAWMVAALPLTNRVNFVSLETQFLSDKAEGLLSVYWGTNVVGSVDERVNLPGVHKYSFPISETTTNGTQTIGFRLDAFSAIQSSVTVSNVALGFSGALAKVTEPFSLSFAGTDPNGLPVLQLTGPSGFNYTVETSTNLVDWKVFAILVNTNGVVRFNTAPNNATARFYRAVAP